MSDLQILIVYNAKSDLFSKSAGLVHKLIHPESYQCELCKITHGAIQEKEDWSDYLENLGYDWQYLYKDHLTEYPIADEKLPAIFSASNGQIQELISKEEIANLNLEKLILLLKNRIPTL